MMMLRSSLVAIALLSLVTLSEQKRPQSRRRQQYCPPDPTVTAKLSELETEQTTLTAELFHQSQLIDDLENDRIESITTQWAMWTTWGGCEWSCTGQDSGRIQTRDRTKTTSASVTQSETESRPCNSVQFARCIKDAGAGDDYAVAYDYKDTVGIAACTAINAAGKFVYAVRRDCNDVTMPCDTICSGIDAALSCVQTLHIYSPSNAPALAHDAVGLKSVYTYRYDDGCGITNCGPNMCCCQSDTPI